MSSASKAFLLILGLLTAVFIVGQLVMGQLILSDPGNLVLRKAHRHSGYTTVVLAIIYVVFSLRVIVSIPTRAKTGA
jgi:hypothetical protein